MTLAAACGWSLVRSLLVALVAWPVCRVATRWLRSLPPKSRRLAWWLVLIPFLCPELWAGYAWSGFGVRLAATGFWNLLPSGFWPTPQSVVARDAAADEALLCVLLFFRALPIGTLVLYFSPPPPLTQEAMFCRKLAAGQAFQPDVRLESLTYIGLPALGLMFLVAFQEFELASLIGRPAWTVWLFDAQVGGLDLSESLRKTVLPVLCQLAVLIPLGWLVMRSRTQLANPRRDTRRISRRAQFAMWSLAVAGLTVMCLLPASQVGRDTLGGLLRVARSASQTRMLLHEVFAGTGYASVAALVSALCASWLLGSAQRSRWAATAAWIVCLPGLVGSLVLGLSTMQLGLSVLQLQQQWLRFAYKSPLSFGAGLVLLLLPRALFVRFLLWSSARPAGEHLSRLMRGAPVPPVRAAGGELAWRLRWSREYWGVALLAYWGYFDLTIASLLAPVTIVSAPVMLYNQMHFGKNATLSALVLLSVLIPLATFSLVAAARRFVFRWLWR
ncbi:MAG: hypothetical protein HY290_16170 [Planctomycetia bacterium]|nr:hypothetical protein [Planctomycetia bacterium]